MSYGSADGVAALTPRYVQNSGAFDATTRPTLASVETWLLQVSTMLDNILTRHGYAVPVGDAGVKPMLDAFVNEEVASMVEGVNGSGRFGPSAKTGGSRARFAVLLEDVNAFVTSISPRGPYAGLGTRALRKEDGYARL